MHFGGAMFFTDYSMSAPELASVRDGRPRLTSVATQHQLHWPPEKPGGQDAENLRPEPARAQATTLAAIDHEGMKSAKTSRRSARTPKRQVIEQSASAADPPAWKPRILRAMPRRRSVSGGKGIRIKPWPDAAVAGL